MNLVNELIKGLLPEQERKKIVAMINKESSPEILTRRGLTKKKSPMDCQRNIRDQARGRKIRIFLLKKENNKVVKIITNRKSTKELATSCI